jgi:hypothetical protein
VTADAAAAAAGEAQVHVMAAAAAELAAAQAAVEATGGRYRLVTANAVCAWRQQRTQLSGLGAGALDSGCMNSSGGNRGPP